MSTPPTTSGGPSSQHRSNGNTVLPQTPQHTTSSTTDDTIPTASPVRFPSTPTNSNVVTPSRQQPQQLQQSPQYQKALDEAAFVLDAVGGQTYLDGFNLLGVVADPRGPGAQLTAFSSTAAASPRHAHSTEPSVGATAAGTLFGSTGASYYQSLESTLSSVTGQMDVWNHVLDDWSRKMRLEDGGVSIMSGGTLQEQDVVLESQKELPPDLADLDVSSLEAYLERSGPKAAAFAEIVRRDGAAFDRNNTLALSLMAEEEELVRDGEQQQSTTRQAADAVGVRPEEELEESSKLVDVSNIPALFFEESFDLTDPQTFGQLIFSTESKSVVLASNGQNSIDPKQLNGPVSDWFPLVPQDALGGHFDTIEMALLQQVRNNSAKFFAESQRFAELQQIIQTLLQQVTELQTSTRHMSSDLLRPMQTVPTANAQRADLQRLETVLERAEDMMLCKHSLGGVLSAQDDLTAIEQIRFGRQLLDGTAVTNNTSSTSTSADDGDAMATETVVVGRLHAFRAVSDQLNQYEQLVVSNLRHELVEIFLTWDSADATSLYGGPTTHSGGAEYGGSGNNNGNGTLVTATTTTTTTTATRGNDPVRERVRDIMRALQSCRALSNTKDMYATRLQDVLRMTVRTTVGEFASDVAPNGAVQSVAMGASSMSLTRFLDCLDMLFEQLLTLVSSCGRVNEFFVTEGISLRDGDADENDTQAPPPATQASPSDASNGDGVIPVVAPLTPVVIASAELASKSVSELLRLRKDAHSLVTLDEMKLIKDACLGFAGRIEEFSGSGHTSTLRSTLLAQAKAFMERQHESNMSALAAALDSERWIQCEVSADRQSTLSRLCMGRPIISSPAKRSSVVNPEASDSAAQKTPDIEAEGTRYRVVWSCLLLIEMILGNLAAAAHFPSLASHSVNKISELLRLFNSRTTQLVLGAGAIHSNAKLKSINAKHLSLVTQCLGMIIAILPHIRAAVMAQMPKKQHTLLSGLDQIKKEYGQHNDKVLNKFVSIIGNIVEHGLSKKIAGTDFDQRAKATQATDGDIGCCVFLEGVSTNTRKMHQVLLALLPPDHLIDTFSRIFSFLDTKVPALLISAANIQPVFQNKGANSAAAKTPSNGSPSFSLPSTDEGKKQLLLEVEAMTKSLNSLEGVRPWDFAATNVLEKTLDFSLHETAPDTNLASEEIGEETDPTEENVPTSEPSNEHTDDTPNTTPVKPHIVVQHDTSDENLVDIDAKSNDVAAPVQNAPDQPESVPKPEVTTASSQPVLDGISDPAGNESSQVSNGESVLEENATENVSVEKEDEAPSETLVS